MSPDRFITYQWITRGIVRTLGCVGVALGVAMDWGGAERFSGPGFATARLIPGGVYTWGTSLAIAGFVVLVGVVAGWQRRIVALGLFLQALWFMFFAVGLAVTTASNPEGSVTGPFAYGGLAILCVIASVGGHGLRA